MRAISRRSPFLKARHYKTLAAQHRGALTGFPWYVNELVVSAVFVEQVIALAAGQDVVPAPP